MKNLLFFQALMLFCLPIFGQNSKACSYSQYSDLEGSNFEPGSFIIVSGNAKALPLISRRDLLKFVEGTNILQLLTNSLPKSNCNIKTEFDKSVTFKSLDNSVKTLIKKSKIVNLDVKSGVSYSISSSFNDIQSLICNLPLRTLEKIKLELTNQSKKIHIVTEVLEFKDANIKIDWDSKIGGEYKGKILKGLQLNGNGNWLSEKSLLIAYSGQKVRYKSIPFDPKYLDLINKQIDCYTKVSTNLITKVVTLSENENCTNNKCGELKDIIISNIDTLNFVFKPRYVKGECCPNGAWEAKDGKEYTSKDDAFKSLRFGAWKNISCKDKTDLWSGNGWYANYGSCCDCKTPDGERNYQLSVQKVKIEVTYKKCNCN